MGNKITVILHLQAAGAARLSRNYVGDAGAIEALLAHNRASLQSAGLQEPASYLMGDTPILLLGFGHAPTAERADRLAPDRKSVV